MNNITFMNHVKIQHNRRKEILNNPRKRRDIGVEDRLIQFKRMAAMRKCSLQSAAIDLCTKQFTDLLDMADGSHPYYLDIEVWRDLISDVQNYLDITLAITEEELADWKGEDE